MDIDPKVTVDAEDLITLMAFVSVVHNDNDEVGAAWGRFWQAMATTNKSAIELHDRISKKAKEYKHNV